MFSFSSRGYLIELYESEFLGLCGCKKCQCIYLTAGLPVSFPDGFQLLLFPLKNILHFVKFLVVKHGESIVVFAKMPVDALDKRSEGRRFVFFTIFLSDSKKNFF